MSLPEHATHYIVPDVDTVLKYLEILELPDFRGISYENLLSNLFLSVFYSVASEICLNILGNSDEKTPPNS